MPRSKVTISILLAAVGPVFTALPEMLAAGKGGESPQAGPPPNTAPAQVVELRGDAGGKRFDGVGVVNGGGATLRGRYLLRHVTTGGCGMIAACNTGGPRPRRYRKG
jgi:hypothetical protein